VEIPDEMSISYGPDSLQNLVYRLSFNMEGLQGALEIAPRSKPFSPFPWGRKPGLARTLFEGARPGACDFLYVSQAPRGDVSGTITMDSRRLDVRGKAYHEQGRFDDAPERLSKKGWFWCHFLHPEWNVFGSPGVFLYVQQQQHERPIFRGLNLFDRSLGFKNRTLAGEPPHHQVFSGGEMRFAYGGLELSIRADPKRNMPLISFPSATTRQIYHTLVTDAQLTVERKGAADSFAGQMILESCWVGL